MPNKVALSCKQRFLSGMAFSIYKAICVAISHDQVQCVVNLFMHVNDFTNAKGNARNLCLQGTVARFKIISFLLHNEASVRG